MARSSVAAETPNWLVQPAIKATVTATTNGTGAPSGEERKDLFTSVQPSAFVEAESPIYKLKALLGADMVAYARGSQANRVYPMIDVDGKLALVNRVLFLESSVAVQAAPRDPYAARGEAGSSQNREVVSAYRVSPVVNYDISSASNLSARYEEILTRGDEGSLANERFSNTFLTLTRKPLPLGGSLQYEGHVIHVTVPTTDVWRIETIKAVGDIKVGDEELLVGPVAGAERTEFAEEKHRNALYGLHLLWNPSSRTRVEAEVDHRFFGYGWNLDVNHRGPGYTVVVKWLRTPVTSSSTLGLAPTGSALGGFLDNLLTTRYPDASERATVVGNLIANRGLPAGQDGPVDVRATYAQLQSDARATLVLLGTRNIISWTVYSSTRRALDLGGDALNELTSRTEDNRQLGMGLDFNRKLSPQLTLDLAGNWSRIRGVGLLGENVTRQQTYHLSLIQALSPRTGVSAGIHFDRLDSSLLTVTSYRALAVSAGLNHRF